MLESIFSLFGGEEKHDSVFKNLVEKAMNDLKVKTASHQSVWGFGKAIRWDLNQDDGLLIFTFPDKVVTCEVQIIGTFERSKGTWLWAWDNPGVTANLAKASRQLFEYGKANALPKLTEAEWDSTESEAWQMVALATLVCEAQGAYRGPAEPVAVFMTFGAPTIKPLNSQSGV